MSGSIPTHGPADPQTGAPIVEIVSAGNEVLIGDVLDTNTNWLCTRVTGLGGLVRHTVMLRDDIEAIADELRDSLARRPALVFTVGGLGPTSDDRTLEGVALGLGVVLELHPEAERLVAAKYEEFHAAGYVPFAELNDSRRKMARLPAGAEPIVNPIGGAPAVLCRAGETRIVSLPGVPGELMAIVDESLGALFADVFGAARYEERSLEVELQDESAIADILRAAEVLRRGGGAPRRVREVARQGARQHARDPHHRERARRERRRRRRAARAGGGPAALADRRRRASPSRRGSRRGRRTERAGAAGSTPAARALAWLVRALGRPVLGRAAASGDRRRRRLRT